MRRAFLMSLAAVAALALAGCGFHLRGAATFTFDSIYLNSSGSPSFNNELKRAFVGANLHGAMPGLPDLQAGFFADCSRRTICWMASVCMSRCSRCSSRSRASACDSLNV